jgi:hypothetical protein
MDRNIAKHLAKRGVQPSCSSRGNLTFSERNPDFFKWFEESVMGFHSDEYHREFWREAYRKGHTIGHVPQTLRNRYRQYNPRMMGGVLFIELALAGSALAVWLIRREIDRHVQRLRRPTYYETERARRLELAEERRRIRRRRTLNAKPGAEMLLAAFRKAKDSVEDMIRFGSLVEDLECYVDNTPYFRDGRLVGRRGGIRRYLEREIPELYAHYKTVMKYKALSRKFRQAARVSDPVPASVLLPGIETNAETSKNATEPLRQTVDVVEKAGNPTDSGCGEFSSDEILSARRVVKEILGACEGTAVSLSAQLALRLSPEYAPSAEGVVPALGQRACCSSPRGRPKAHAPELKRIPVEENSVRISS